MNENEIDQKVANLMSIVATKKAEIAKAEKPKWETHLSFGYNEEKGSERTNIQIITDTTKLVDILAFLLQKSEMFDKAVQKLKIPSLQFKWMGYTVDEWERDITTRIGQILLSSRKKELETLEGKLSNLLSPEQKRAIELEAIAKSLE